MRRFTFFDVIGIVQNEFLPQSQTINQQVYKSDPAAFALPSAWKETRDDVAGQIIICSRRPEHLAVPGCEGHCFTETTSVWCFPFSKLKVIIKGTCFEGVESIKRGVMTECKGIQEESFQQCIDAWQRKIGKCIRLEGDLLWRGNHVVCYLELK